MHGGEGKERQRVFRALSNRLGRKGEALRMCSTDHSLDHPGLWREGKEGAELVGVTVKAGRGHLDLIQGLAELL